MNDLSTTPDETARGRKKALHSNGAASILTQGCKTAVAGLWLLLLARFLVPEQLGIYLAAFSLVRVFGVIATLGLDRILVKHFVENPGHVRSLIWRGLVIKFIAFLVAYGSLLLTVAALFPRQPLLLTVSAIMGVSLLSQTIEVIDFYLQSCGKMWLIFLGRALPLVLALALKLCWLNFHPSLIVIAVLEIAETLLVTIGLLCVFSRNKPATNTSQTPSPQLSLMLHQGLPLLVSSLAIILYMKADVIMLGRMVGPIQTGLYGVAAQLSEMWAFIPLALAAALFPEIGRWQLLDHASFWKKYQVTMQAAFFMAVIVAGLLTYFASPIIVFVFGESYRASAPILQIHAWSSLFIFLGIAQSGFDIFQNLTWLATWRTIAGVAVNILLNLIWIPIYGAKGAAWATLISYGCSAFLLNSVHKSTRPVFLIQLRSMLLLDLKNLIAICRVSLSRGNS